MLYQKPHLCYQYLVFFFSQVINSGFGTYIIQFASEILVKLVQNTEPYFCPARHVLHVTNSLSGYVPILSRHVT